MEKTIYMPLVGEGTECWRPVQASQVGKDIFEVVEKIPENESWAFAPYSRVRYRDKVFADGQVGRVVFAYAIESNPHYRVIKDKDNEKQVFRIVLAEGEEAVVRSCMSTRSMRTSFMTCSPQISMASIVLRQKERFT